MRTNKTKSVVCAFVLLLSALAVSAQTYPDYAFASLSSMPFSNWSLIRVYSPTKALVLYKTVGSGTKVSLIDMGLGMKSVDLEPGYVVYDMEIAGNYLFMCGQYNLSKAFLAVGNEGDNWDNLILHRCDKENVIATFNDYYKFPVPNPEGMTYYLCCHMAEDTIGIASRGSGILGQYETRIRVVDAASMVMTSSQLFNLNDYKTDPTDMVYCTGTQTLVMLQLQKFPPSLGGDYYGFLHLKPYATAPYYAEGMVEYSRLLSSSPLPFYSLDRVPDGKHYVSSGGECWLMNNSVSGMPTSNCRLADKINVKLEDNILVNHLNYGFYNCMVEFNVHQYNRAVINGAFTPVCYEL